MNVESGMPPREEALSPLRAQQFLPHKHRQNLPNKKLRQPGIVRTADSAYIAALDAVADAYDELRDAQAFAATMNKVFTNAAKKKSAAENAYNNCVETAANNNCKAELDASLKADAEFAAAQTASWEADMAVVAAQAELDNARANFRAKIEAKMAAKEELDKARIALSKCLGGRIR
jgi:membrane protein involved in colicin uptake